VALDPYTGAVTETVLWRDFPVLAKLTRTGVLAHMGLLFGLFNQLALVATALGLLCMLFWGYRMWWQRRPTRGAFRLTPPVRRGTMRSLAQPASFAVVLLTVAVGWMLPVLGVSLLIFVAATPPPERSPGVAWGVTRDDGRSYHPAADPGSSSDSDWLTNT
jgi:uncharacterized iron-regulated membrane protein